MILSIDPGTRQSGYVWLDNSSTGGHTPRVYERGVTGNSTLLAVCQEYNKWGILAVEDMQSMGDRVGQSVFRTCQWAGLFIGAWRAVNYTLVRRTDVKKHHCPGMRAKDKDIRAALIARYETDTQPAIGIKKHPGPLYGVSSHAWSALAIGLYVLDVNPEPRTLESL